MIPCNRRTVFLEGVEAYRSGTVRSCGSSKAVRGVYIVVFIAEYAGRTWD